MKFYTDIQQSKKLAEILPIDSADMRYGYIAPYDYSDRMYDGGYDEIPYPKDFLIKNPNFSANEYDAELPCWSLVALLETIPKHIKEFNVLRIDIADKDFSIWYDEIGFGVNNELPDITMESPIDACYEMVIKLHEDGLLMSNKELKQLNQSVTKMSDKV